MNGAEKPRMVNLGCGRRFHPDWINFDIQSHSPAVIAHDLRQGIPLPDDHCDVVYHSNIIEHMRREEAAPFLRECLRVLRPGGFIRIAAPDLERIARLYLEKLQTARENVPGAEDDYDWMVLELYDQTVRERSGGGMVEYLKRQALPNEAFILERIGEEGRRLLQDLRHPSPPSPSRPPRLVRNCRRAGRWIQNRLLRLIAGADAPAALEIGRFRLGGEAHQWMYDAHSLGRLLKTAGFERPDVRGAAESDLSGWSRYDLDTLPDGTPTKPDAFYMEAIKPLQSGGKNP